MVFFKNNSRTKRIQESGHPALQGMELQEKKHKKIKTYRKSLKKEPQNRFDPK